MLFASVVADERWFSGLPKGPNKNISEFGKLVCLPARKRTKLPIYPVLGLTHFIYIPPPPHPSAFASKYTKHKCFSHIFRMLDIKGHKLGNVLVNENSQQPNIKLAAPVYPRGTRMNDWDLDIYRFSIKSNLFPLSLAPPEVQRFNAVDIHFLSPPMNERVMRITFDCEGCKCETERGQRQRLLSSMYGYCECILNISSTFESISESARRQHDNGKRTSSKPFINGFAASTH